MVNQLLTEMDGFESNRGIVVLAATNRPSVLDEALTRPGRFDRKLVLTLPGLEGRVEILKVHSRGKRLDHGIDWKRVARACGGMTGADLANVLNEAAIIASRSAGKSSSGTPAALASPEAGNGNGAVARAGAGAGVSAGVITEEMLLDTIERQDREASIMRRQGSSELTAGDAEANLATLSPDLRRSVASYEAGKALAGLLCPFYDELQKVVVFPGGQAAGYSYFLPREAHLETGVMSRGYLEACLTVLMAGRCAEVLLMGPEKVRVRLCVRGGWAVERMFCDSPSRLTLAWVAQFSSARP